MQGIIKEIMCLDIIIVFTMYKTCFVIQQNLVQKDNINISCYVMLTIYALYLDVQTYKTIHAC
jgi:hypothetical protein